MIIDYTNTRNSIIRKNLTSEQIAKLTEIGSILKSSNVRSRTGERPDFAPQEPIALMGYMAQLCRYNLPMLDRPSSLELECGTAGWTLMAAAMGFPAYGIDKDPFLIAEARGNLAKAIKAGLIEPGVSCRFAAGNYLTEDYLVRHKDELKRKYGEPRRSEPGGRPYEELGIDINEMGIVFAKPFTSRRGLIGDFLNEVASPESIIVFSNYDLGCRLELAGLSDAYWDGYTMIGKKATQKSGESLGLECKIGDRVRIVPSGDMRSRSYDYGYESHIDGRFPEYFTLPAGSPGTVIDYRYLRPGYVVMIDGLEEECIFTSREVKKSENSGDLRKE
jgi:hypothetical protein